MKKYIVILIFFIVARLSGFNFNYTLERLDVDFNGVAYSGDTVVCYGTGSMILYSSDMGETWLQKNIHHDSLDIRQLIFKDNRYIGILNKNYIVTGTSDAQNWQNHYTGIQIQKSIEIYNDNVYVLSENYINIIRNDNIFNKIKLPEGINFHELKVFHDKLLIAGDKSKLLILDIMHSYKERLIDFYQLGLCGQNITVRSMQVSNDTIYIQAGSNVLCSKNTRDWITKVKNLNLLFTVYRNVIYGFYTKHFKLPHNLARVYLMSAVPVFIKYKSKDRFDKISLDWKQRNIDVIATNCCRFINEKTIIAVGRDKCIMMSYDGGIHWQLKSYFKAGGFDIINDTLFYAIRPKGKIYKSTNAGITWMPPLFNDTLVSRMKYLDSWYFKDNGYGFVLYRTPSYNYKNILVTYDFGENYELRYNYWLATVKSIYGRMIIDTDSGFNVITPETSLSYDYTNLIELDTALSFVKERKVDSIQIMGIKRIGDGKIIGLAKDKHWPYNKVENDMDSLNYLFMYSNDNGLTWTKNLDFFMKDTILKNGFYFSKNKILIGGVHFYKEPINDTLNVNQLFLIDLETRNKMRLFNSNISTFSSIASYKNWILIGGWESILINDNFESEPSQWIVFPIKGKYISSIRSTYKNLWFFIYDIHRNKNHYYKVNMKYLTDILQSNIETNKEYLYAYPPYPNPAQNIVNTKIYWDQRYDIDDSEMSIFDYAGNKISGRNELTLIKLNNYSGILSWDCSKYNSGIYFIVIKHGDATRSIPLVINR